MKNDKIKKCLIAGYDMDIISQEELNEYWNYITNLQEENKVLLEKYSTIQILYNSSKLKNDKAIEYNQQIIKDTKDFYRPTEDIIYSGDTLIDIAMNNINILQGGGEE